MSKEIIEITASCPSVFTGENASLIIVGDRIDPKNHGLENKVSETEAAIQISADLVKASLGLTELIEAAEDVLQYGDAKLYRIRDALNKIKGQS